MNAVRITRGDILTNNAARNALRLVGFDLTDVSQDRPLTPDGQDLLCIMWESGMGVPEIMEELRLSEARVSAELLFCELKGKLFGFVWTVCLGRGRRGD